MTCHRCGDTRRITIMVPNVRRSGGVEYVSSSIPEKPEVHECPVCTTHAGNLDTILQHTLTRSLIDSDRAAQS